MKKLQKTFRDLKKAVRNLKEAVKVAKTQLEIDGVIQRFEFTFELAWKTIRLFLDEEGIECKSPKMAIKEAYAYGFIKNERVWLKILRDRNLTTHIYHKEMSRRIFGSIKERYLAEFEQLAEIMQKSLKLNLSWLNKKSK